MVWVVCAAVGVDVALMAGSPTPEAAALSGFAPHVNASVIHVTLDADRAEVAVRTDDSPDEIIRCVRRDDGWYTVDEVGG
jgi:hypothetical protein